MKSFDWSLSTPASKRVATINTMHLDKFREIFIRVASKCVALENNTYLEYLSRPGGSHELSKWSSLVIAFLHKASKNKASTIDEFDEPDVDTLVVQHLNALRNFYRCVCEAKLNEADPNLARLFTLLQSYEVVVALTFVHLQNEANSQHVSRVSEELAMVTHKLSAISSNDHCPCFTSGGGVGGYTCCFVPSWTTTTTSSSDLIDMLERVDKLVGGLDVRAIGEAALDTCEMLCTYSHVSLDEGLSALGCATFASYHNVNESGGGGGGEWKLTESSERLLEQLASSAEAGEERTLAIRRLMQSLARCYATIQTTLGESASVCVAVQSVVAATKSTPKFAASSLAVTATAALAVNDDAPLYTPPWYDDIVWVGEVLRQLELVIVAHLSTTLSDTNSTSTTTRTSTTTSATLTNESRGETIAFFELAAHFDECARIVHKFARSHLVFKMTNGSSYLKKLRVVVKRSTDVMQRVPIHNIEHLQQHNTPGQQQQVHEVRF